MHLDYQRILLVLLGVIASGHATLAADRMPNVVIIFTDDQGYGGRLIAGGWHWWLLPPVQAEAWIASIGGQATSATRR